MIREKILDTTIEIIVGDIVTQDTDAIVNAANVDLAVGGGVCGAIHRAAGKNLEEVCKAIGHCDTGNSVVTAGYDLKSRYIIHAVAPIYQDGQHDEPKLLRRAYQSALWNAEEKDCLSVSFPSLGTGIYGYPMEDAAYIMFAAIISQLKNQSPLRLIRIVLFDQKAYDIHAKAFEDSVYWLTMES